MDHRSWSPSTPASTCSKVLTSATSMHPTTLAARTTAVVHMIGVVPGVADMSDAEIPAAVAPTTVPTRLVIERTALARAIRSAATNEGSSAEYAGRYRPVPAPSANAAALIDHSRACAPAVTAGAPGGAAGCARHE